MLEREPFVPQPAETRRLTVSAAQFGLTDELVLPGDGGWDGARQAWNLGVDQHPAAVAIPSSVENLAKAVRYARANHLRISAQGTGHGAQALGPLANALLVKTSGLREVRIDPERRRVHVQAGAQWQDVTVPAAEHGLAALSGSSPNVGVVGYSLGGGVGWLARRFGMCSESIRAADVVTADGTPVRVDADHEPDLFWALRGGGGSFAVVTALELEQFPARELYAGNLFWPLERAPEVLEAWRTWVQDVPEELTSLARLLRVPPLPGVPEALRGRAFVLVEAAYLGSEADGAAWVRPLRELQPEIDTFTSMSPPGLRALHMDPEMPVASVGDGALLTSFPSEAADQVLGIVGEGTESMLLSVEVRHLGGELAESRPGQGPLMPLDAAFAIYGVGIAADEGSAAATHADLDRLLDAVRPWDRGRSFPTLSERAGTTLFPPDVYNRLRDVKRRYDPGNVLAGGHPIHPAG
jgi:FAD/FMN-containing dehydrogenase